MVARLRRIELDAQTVATLERRAEARGLSVAELVAELADREVEPAEVADAEVADLDAEWAATEAGGAVPHERVVRWLQTWGTGHFRPWRDE